MENTNQIEITGVVVKAMAIQYSIIVNVAVKVKYQNGKQSPTVYYSVHQTFPDAEQANIAAEKLKRGTSVLVTGQLGRHASYMKDGSQRYINSIYHAQIEPTTNNVPKAELTLSGRLSSDPVRHGSTVAFPMSARSHYGIFWIDSIIFTNESANLVEKNLKKGDFVTVTGRLEERSHNGHTMLMVSCSHYPTNVQAIVQANVQVCTSESDAQHIQNNMSMFDELKFRAATAWMMTQYKALMSK